MKGGFAPDAIPVVTDAEAAGTRFRVKSILMIAATLVVIGLSAVALNRMVAGFNFDDFMAAVESTSWTQISLALAFTGLSFFALSLYDVQALRFAGASMPYPLVALASFCAYSVGNIAGFGPLTGGSIRYRFYAPLGLDGEAIAKIIAYVAAAFGFGLLFVTGLGLTLAGPDIADLVGQHRYVIRGLGVAAVSFAVFTILLAALRPAPLNMFGRQVPLPRVGDMLAQLLATSVDVAAAAAVLYVLLPAGDMDYLTVLAVFSVAIGAGVLSHLPGGVGIFDTIVLSALSQRLPVDGVISALFLYRVIYFVVPLVLSILALVTVEARRATLRNAALSAALKGITPTLVGTLTVVLGVMEVFSGVTPKDGDYLDIVSTLFPLPLVEGAHFIGSIIGVFLIIAGRGLVYRLDGAWWMAVLLTALSIPLALVKSMAIGEAAFLAILIVGLLSTRRLYRRRASLLHDHLSAVWWLCLSVVMALAIGVLLFAYREVPYSHDLWWQFEIDAEAPRGLRALLGMGLALAALATWMLTRPPTGRVTPPTAEDIARAATIVAKSNHAEANLVRMGDKSILFSSDGEAFLMFAKRGRSWVALGDPIGSTAGQTELVWRFVELAREHGGRAVFYQASAERLSLYADAGLSPHKLGEEAVVDLSAFDLKGSRRGNLRNAINKSERDGTTFALLEPDAVAAVLPELRAVSDAWLGERNAREKTFSIGAFEDGYVASQPVAVLRDTNGRIFAFATILLAGPGVEAGIDLMRFEPDSPNGTMELLFTRLLMHFKERGYRHFTLGMAPLSGLSGNPEAPFWHKLGRAVFDHGNAFYNFHGLKAFKAKFDPVWKQKYLAVSSGLNPLLALADVTFIIGGGIKGVLTR